MSSGTATVTTDVLNVRSGAGTEYARIGSLTWGRQVSYSADQNGWLKINYNNQIGYISKAYTNTTSAATSSTSYTPSSSSSVNLTDAQIQTAIAFNQGNVQHLCTKIQQLVGVDVDNSFGPITVRAIAAWQASNGLEVDGCFGPLSQAKANFAGGGSSNQGQPEQQQQQSEQQQQQEKPAETQASTQQQPTNTNLLNSQEEAAAIKYNQANSQAICKDIQTLVGVEADGSFGPITVQAIARWQKANGLVVDGQFGPKSCEKSGIKPKISETVRNGNLNAHTVDYKQYSEPWGSKLYSRYNDPNETYARSACGPTALANVIATKVDSSVTPYTLGQWAVANGHMDDPVGTYYSFFPACARLYGLSANVCSVEEGVQKLQAGYYCVASMGPGYWTSFGHLITPYASDGVNIYVDDPAGRHTQQDKYSFAGECKQMWYFS